MQKSFTIHSCEDTLITSKLSAPHCALLDHPVFDLMKPISGSVHHTIDVLLEVHTLFNAILVLTESLWKPSIHVLLLQLSLEC